jgi:hypothetical protein
MKQLVQIAPADLAAVWSRVRPGLESMDKADGWIPEDVYCSLKLGHATLYLVTIDEVEHGFLVLRALQDYDGARLHIWVLHSTTGVDVMAAFSDELDEMGRRIGAKKLTFGTTRRGWAKTAPKYGFSQLEVIWQRSIGG